MFHTGSHLRPKALRQASLYKATYYSDISQVLYIYVVFRTACLSYLFFCFLQWHPLFSRKLKQTTNENKTLKLNIESINKRMRGSTYVCVC